jgi:hypothetical protein
MRCWPGAHPCLPRLCAHAAPVELDPWRHHLSPPPCPTGACATGGRIAGRAPKWCRSKKRRSTGGPGGKPGDPGGSCRALGPGRVGPLPGLICTQAGSLRRAGRAQRQGAETSGARIAAGGAEPRTGAANAMLSASSAAVGPAQAPSLREADTDRHHGRRPSVSASTGEAGGRRTL